jgi:uncharacterized protein (UPF0332 family)
MHAKDFLDLAATLTASDAEASQRSAVSRAYYGAFHAARQLLVDAGLSVPPTGEAHRKIQLCLKESRDDIGKEAANDLEALRVYRNAADYDLRDPRFRNRKMVGIWVALARSVVTQLEELHAEPAWPQFRNSVRTYAAQVLRIPLT